MTVIEVIARVSRLFVGCILMFAGGSALSNRHPCHAEHGLILLGVGMLLVKPEGRTK